MVLWSFAATSAANAALQAADKPCAIARTATYGTEATLGRWQWSYGPNGDFTDTDHTDTTHAPTRYMQDGLHHRRSYMLADVFASFSVCYVLMRLNGVPIDSALILGHNFGSIDAAGLQLHLALSDLSTFPGIGAGAPAASGDARSVVVANVFSGTAPWPLGQDSRAVNLSLKANGAGSAGKFSGALYARLRIATASGSDFPASAYPAIGEIILGERIQLAHKGLQQGYDDKRLETDANDFHGATGVDIRYVRSRGRKTFDHTWHSADATELQKFDDLYYYSNQSSKRITWIENPGTQPTRAFYGLMSKDSAQPLQGPYDRFVPISFRESSPYRELET
jgi:hypothetical protein